MMEPRKSLWYNEMGGHSNLYSLRVPRPAGGKSFARAIQKSAFLGDR